jgi:hypothetical protein
MKNYKRFARDYQTRMKTDRLQDLLDWSLIMRVPVELPSMAFRLEDNPVLPDHSRQQYCRYLRGDLK